MASPNDSDEGVRSTALSFDAGDGRSLPRYSLFFDVVGSDEGWAMWSGRAPMRLIVFAPFTVIVFGNAEAPALCLR